jgi:hypothetical protein
VDFNAFEKWIGHLSGVDLEFLRGHAHWLKVHREISRTRVIPKGFVEKTMEILEGGSESET